MVEKVALSFILCVVCVCVYKHSGVPWEFALYQESVRLSTSDTNHLGHSYPFLWQPARQTFERFLPLWCVLLLWRLPTRGCTAWRQG